MTIYKSHEHAARVILILNCHVQFQFACVNPRTERTTRPGPGPNIFQRQVSYAPRIPLIAPLFISFPFSGLLYLSPWLAHVRRDAGELLLISTTRAAQPLSVTALWQWEISQERGTLFLPLSLLLNCQNMGLLRSVNSPIRSREPAALIIYTVLYASPKR